MRIAVIGAGAMGAWFANLLKKNAQVTVSDIDSKTAEETASKLGVTFAPQEKAVGTSDMILIAVPISEAPKVVKSVLGFAKRGALVVDITSVKSDVVEVMKEFEGKVELASIHPLFGPGATTLRGKDVISIPVRTGKKYRWLKSLMVKGGANFIEMEADEHDRLMSIIQSLTHFTLMTYLTCIGSLKEYARVEKVRTPFFSELRELARSFLHCNPEMYGEIQVHNKYSRIVRSHFIEACRSLDLAFSSGDFRSTPEFMKEAKKMLGPEKLEKSYRKMYERFEGEEG